MPRKVGELFGGNLMSQLLFAITLGTVARAFGYHVPISSLILINTVVGLFAGLLPVPGGVGVSEAGLALGLHPSLRRRAQGVHEFFTCHDPLQSRSCAVGAPSL